VTYPKYPNKPRQTSAPHTELMKEFVKMFLIQMMRRVYKGRRCCITEDWSNVTRRL